MSLPVAASAFGSESLERKYESEGFVDLQFHSRYISKNVGNYFHSFREASKYEKVLPTSKQLFKKSKLFQKR